MITFEEAMAFRHACKRFDKDKKIPSEQLERLLETLRLSPSSFGMEPWRVIVVQSADVKAMLRPLCWNQEQITSCSDLIIFTTNNSVVRSGSDYVKTMFQRRGLDAAAVETYMQVYANYLAPIECDEKLLENWTAKQCYITAANVMSHAAALQIDSCPIEGFDKAGVEAALKLDKQHHLALIVALGYRVDTPKKRQRLSKEQIISYM